MGKFLWLENKYMGHWRLTSGNQKKIKNYNKKEETCIHSTTILFEYWRCEGCWGTMFSEITRLSDSIKMDITEDIKEEQILLDKTKTEADMNVDLKTGF